MEINELTQKVIGAAIEVHKSLGPGLLESIYEECQCHELNLRGVPFKRQLPLPMAYKGLHFDCRYRTDIVVDDVLLLELKAVEALDSVHEAQLLTSLHLGGWKIGLLKNFNVKYLKDGIYRRVVGLVE